MELREFRAELPSTQIEAVQRARDGAPAGTWVVAACQTAGLGRADHRWASPPGNLYVSVIVPAPVEHRSLVPLAVGAELRRNLAERYGIRPVLKWPNDLLILGRGRPRKLAGILVDLVPSPRLGHAAVVGIGVNVAAPTTAYPDALRPQVVNLSDLVSPPASIFDVEAIAVRSASEAARALDSVEGSTRVLAECRGALHGVGRRATVDDSLTGIVRTVGDDGELWLDTPSGAVAIRSGDVVVEEA